MDLLLDQPASLQGLDRQRSPTKPAASNAREGREGRGRRRHSPTTTRCLGDDAFETGTGVHASAVIKAFKKGDVEARRHPSTAGVPAGMVGLEQKHPGGPDERQVPTWCGLSSSSDIEPTDGTKPSARCSPQARPAKRLLTDDQEVRSAAASAESRCSRTSHAAPALRARSRRICHQAAGVACRCNSRSTALLRVDHNWEELVRMTTDVHRHGSGPGARRPLSDDGDPELLLDLDRHVSRRRVQRG